MAFSRRAFAIGAATAGAAPIALSAASKTAQAESRRAPRDIYVMSNQPSGNEILLVRRRLDNGAVSVRNGSRGRFATGGRGLNATAPVDPLGSQNALVRSGRFLVAVNAGSNNVSLMEILNSGRLINRGIAPSGGTFPASVAVDGNLIYVMNAAVSGTGPTVGIIEIVNNANGRPSLQFLSSHPVGIPSVDNHNLAPGQVLLDGDRRNVIVVDGGGQQILSAPLDNDGIPSAAFTATAVEGPVPFSGAITAFGHLLVASAGGFLASYDVLRDGSLTDLSGGVANAQTATCWVLPVTDSHAITTSTISGTFSLYGFARDGSLTLIDATAASPGGAPTDIGTDPDRNFLYALDPAAGAVLAYAIDSESGALTFINSATGLPANVGIQGLAVGF